MHGSRCARCSKRAGDASERAKRHDDYLLVRVPEWPMSPLMNPRSLTSIRSHTSLLACRVSCWLTRRLAMHPLTHRSKSVTCTSWAGASTAPTAATATSSCRARRPAYWRLSSSSCPAAAAGSRWCTTAWLQGTAEVRLPWWGVQQIALSAPASPRATVFAWHIVWIRHDSICGWR